MLIQHVKVQNCVVGGKTGLCTRLRRAVVPQYAGEKQTCNQALTMGSGNCISCRRLAGLHDSCARLGHIGAADTEEDVNVATE